MPKTEPPSKPNIKIQHPSLEDINTEPPQINTLARHPLMHFHISFTAVADTNYFCHHHFQQPVSSLPTFYIYIR